MIRTKLPKLEQPVKLSLWKLQRILSEKQKRFCHEYCSNGWNGKKAAIKAKYSAHTAHVKASQLLTKPNIKQYIEYIREDYEKLCGINKARVIKELSKIAFSSVVGLHNSWVNLIDFEELKRFNPEMLDIIEIIDTKKEQRVIDKELVEIKYVKLKLYNKLEAIQGINKMMGYNEPDKVDMTAKINNVVDLSKYSDEEKKVLLAIARKNEYIQ